MDSQRTALSPQVYWAGVMLATLVGLGLRLYGMWGYDFWTDELMAIRSSHSIETINAHCFQRFTSPPTRYLLTWAFLNYQHEEKLIRLPSLVAGTLSILAGAVAAARWFGRPVGLWTAWILAANPWLIAYSQDGRMHIVAMFAYLAGIALALPKPERWRPQLLLGGGFCFASSSSITYPAVIICFGGLAVVLFEFLRVSPRTAIRDFAWFAAPWGIWMGIWLSLLWWMTAFPTPLPNSALPPSSEATSNTTPIEATSTVDLETPIPPQPSPPPAEIVAALPPPPPPKTPLLDSYFYRESFQGFWNDRPLKFLTVLGFLAFLFWRIQEKGPTRLSRALLFAIPIAIILYLSPQQLYRRYLLSLLPFPLIGIALCSQWFSRNYAMTAMTAAVLGAATLIPTSWVLRHPPQPWSEVREYLETHLERDDRLLMGSHQGDLAGSFYLVGEVPTWNIVYYAFQNRKYETEAAKEGECWFVQWFGLPPHVEDRILDIYDKAAIFQGRFGTITVYRERAGEAG